jgi:hypothetical protein
VPYYIEISQTGFRFEISTKKQIDMEHMKEGIGHGRLPARHAEGEKENGYRGKAKKT